MNGNGRAARVESCFPGRVRLRLPAHDHRPVIIRNIETLLENTPGVRRVSCNTSTGSVLVEHNPDVIDHNRVVTLAEAQVIADIGEVALHEVEEYAPPEVSKTANKILDEVKTFDQIVNRMTGGLIDAKTSVVIFLFILAMARVFGDPRRSPAPWYTLLWYSYSIFMHWHRSAMNNRTVV